MKFKPVILILFVALILSSCSSEEDMRSAASRMAPDDDEKLALDCLVSLRQREFDHIMIYLHPDLLEPGYEADLGKLADILTQSQSLSFELVGVNVFSMDKKRRSDLTYQFQFANEWVLANVTIDTVDDFKRIVGIHIQSLSESLEETNDFTFGGKSARHYIFYTLAILIPLFIIGSLVLCLFTKMRKKWLWAIFIIFGFVTVSLNWTTGQIDFYLLSFQILGASKLKYGTYAPWILSVSFPLGAVLFLLYVPLNRSNRKKPEYLMPWIRYRRNAHNSTGFDVKEGE